MSRHLVARASELAELAVAVGNGGAVLAGPTGVGKTALAAVVGSQVEVSGGRVERLVATAASSSIAFGALGPLLPDDASVLHPALVAGAIRRRQRELGAVGAPLIIVDDAHLLDDHSAVTLLGLVSTGAVRLMVTITSGEPAPDAVIALWKDELVTRHEIRPFDRASTREFLSMVLGGEVAAGTASMLWQHTRGNALYLRELALHAQAHGGLIDEQGIWIWRGDLGAPPRLADLLDRRFEGFTSTGLDALGALVLGEPLPVAALEDVAGAAGVAELEARHIVETTDHDGVVWYRFVHPMLGAAATHRLSTARRRRVADALVSARGQETDIVRRAVLQLDASTTPDPDVMRAGAAAVFLTQPELARRLAERALPHDPTPQSALLLADAYAELGQLDAVRRAQVLAREKVHSPDDLLSVRLNHISVTAFSDRRPDVALELLVEARAPGPLRERHRLDGSSGDGLLGAPQRRP